MLVGMTIDLLLHSSIVTIIALATEDYQIGVLVKIELSMGPIPTPWIKGTITVFLVLRSMTLSIRILLPNISSPPS
jgi:hypothetical protein